MLSVAGRMQNTTKASETGLAVFGNDKMLASDIGRISAYYGQVASQWETTETKS